MSAVIFLLSLVTIVVISRFTKPVDIEQIGNTLWHPEMMKLPESEIKDGYPWWKWIGFWFTILSVCFVIIYIVFW
jgi:hypothetical protein